MSLCETECEHNYAELNMNICGTQYEQTINQWVAKISKLHFVKNDKKNEKIMLACY